MFAADNIVKQDFMSVRSFDNWDGYLDHTRIKYHTLLIDQGSQVSFGPHWALWVSKYMVITNDVSDSYE
jgi:hypothetical protein